MIRCMVYVKIGSGEEYGLTNITAQFLGIHPRTANPVVAMMQPYIEVHAPDWLKGKYEKGTVMYPRWADVRFVDNTDDTIKGIIK